MKNIKLIIIEDDNYNIRAVTKIIESQFGEIKIIDTASRVQEAIQKIETLRPDLLLMDIHLIDGTAFDILRTCKYTDFKIVFMSAYHEYAVKAMQYAAVEFVFKPFDINELIVAIDKAIEQIQDSDYQIRINTLFNNIDHKNHSVVLQGRETVKACDINEIVWAKAIYGGANFRFIDKSYFSVSKPLRRYEALLSDLSFFRCHPYYLINIAHVINVNVKSQYINTVTNDQIPFESRRYNHMKNLLLNRKHCQLIP